MENLTVSSTIKREKWIVLQDTLPINNPAKKPIKAEPFPDEPDPLAATISPVCHPGLSEGTYLLRPEPVNPYLPMKTESLLNAPDPLATTTPPTCHLEPSEHTYPLQAEPTEALPLQDQVWHQHQSDSGSIGNMIISIKETGICKRSLFTGWHVMRARGLMMMIIKSKHLGLGRIVRLSIKRKHPDFSSFPINRICEKHQADSPFNQDNVLQPGPNEDNWIFDHSGSHKSIVYFLNENQSSKRVEIRVMCSDTCKTSTDINFQPREISRDLILEITVENKYSKAVLEQETIRIWTKAAVKTSDLNKKVRRESKGALAILKKRQRLMVERNPQVTSKAKDVLKEAHKMLRDLGFTGEEILFMARKEVMHEQEDRTCTS